jgi:hypothetical protein
VPHLLDGRVDAQHTSNPDRAQEPHGVGGDAFLGTCADDDTGSMFLCDSTRLPKIPPLGLASADTAKVRVVGLPQDSFWSADLSTAAARLMSSEAMPSPIGPAYWR